MRRAEQHDARFHAAGHVWENRESRDTRLGRRFPERPRLPARRPSKLEVLTKNVKEMFGEALPAQTLVPVPKLAIDPMLFEVEAVAVLD
jgi:hypothetical protein